MDAYEAAALVNVSLQRRFLFFVFKDFVVGVIEDDGLLLLEAGSGKQRGIIRNFDHEIVFRAEFFDGFDTRRNIVVNVQAFARLVFCINEDFPFAWSIHREAGNAEGG